MAAKSKAGRLENEIEKCRAEGNWSKALDLARQISTKSTHSENYATFIYGEGKLEKYLLEHPANEKNIQRACEELPEASKHFEMVLHADAKSPLLFDIQLLSAKICYAMGEYDEARKKISESRMDGYKLDKQSARRLRMISEAYAIKGLCLEKSQSAAASPTTPKDKALEDEIIRCFEKSGDISLSQLQAQYDKSKNMSVLTVATSGTWNFADAGDQIGLGPFTETAIQRSPIYHIKRGDMSKGIGRFRDLLRAIETRAVQNLRQTLARQLAEVLLRGVCETNYEGVRCERDGVTNGRSSPIRPKQATCDGLFVPGDQTEETLLLLLICESMTNREAVLNRSTEHTETRLHTFHNSAAVYDLLTIALVKRAQFHMLSDTFERAMKFSYNEFHIWYQFALSLICAQKYVRALLVLKECIRLDPKHAVVKLQAARLCFEHLHLFTEAVEFAEGAVKEAQGTPLLSRAYLYLGIAYGHMANEAKMNADRQSYQRQAIDTLTRCCYLDRNDFLAHFHLALQRANIRQIPESMKEAKKALELRHDHGPSLHLMALLLSANKEYEEALELIESAIGEHPDNFSLWFTKCRLEEVVYGVEDSLHTCKQMLHMWKDICEPILENDQRGTGLLERVTTDRRSLVQLQLTELSDRDSGSIRADSLAASKMEQTLSEVASSVTSSIPPKHGGPQQAWILQAQIWLHIAELYLSMHRLEEVQACITEASNIFPISHMVSFMKGRFNEAIGNISEAKTNYENSIAINPGHVKSMQHLGYLHHKLGNNRLAEKILRDGISVDPTCSKSWHHLGIVLQSLEDNGGATECLMSAINLEQTDPISHFNTVTKMMD